MVCCQSSLNIDCLLLQSCFCPIKRRQDIPDKTLNDSKWSHLKCTVRNWGNTAHNTFNKWGCQPVPACRSPPRRSHGALCMHDHSPLVGVTCLVLTDHQAIRNCPDPGTLSRSWSLLMRQYCLKWRLKKSECSHQAIKRLDTAPLAVREDLPQPGSPLLRALREHTRGCLTGWNGFLSVLNGFYFANFFAECFW